MPELSVVKDELARLVEDYERNIEFYATNETQTRISLLNPLWSVLGWNPANPREVREFPPTLTPRRCGELR